MAMAKRIVITGAGGYLGGLLADHLASRGGYDLVLIGRSEQPGRSMLLGDIAEWEEPWTNALKDAHAVVHLAGLRADRATWAQVQRTNIDGTLNVFEAAARGGARRMVFASTSWVMGGYFKRHTTLTPDMEPIPSNDYAISKLAGESIARHFAARHGLSCICFRIGTCHRSEQDPEKSDYASQLKWLSARDFCQAAERAIEAKGDGFAILNLTSRIEGSPWDISETQRMLGYTPQDSHQPRQHSTYERLVRRAKRQLRLG